jgi:hypothetical protein
MLKQKLFENNMLGRSMTLEIHAHSVSRQILKGTTTKDFRVCGGGGDIRSDSAKGCATTTMDWR